MARGQRSPAVAALAVCLVLGVILGGASTARTAAARQDATPTTRSALERAAAWLQGQQLADGGFVAFAGESDPGATVDAVIALAVARNAGLDVAQSLERAATYLASSGDAYGSQGIGQAAKLALAAQAIGPGADLDPGAMTVDPADLATPSGVPGIVGSGVFDHALVVLALAGSGKAVPPAVLDALGPVQGADGSWAFSGDTAPGAGDTNTTALAIQALVAAGRGGDPMVAAGLGFLRSAQAPGGGFAYQPIAPLVADANSTAVAVQAIIAAGEDWRGAAGALAAFQNPSGAFRYTDDQPDDNLFATVQAIPALAGAALPIRSGAGDAPATPVARWAA